MKQVFDLMYQRRVSQLYLMQLIRLLAELRLERWLFVLTLDCLTFRSYVPLGRRKTAINGQKLTRKKMPERMS